MHNQIMTTVDEIINPAHTALIVVDMQVDFCCEHGKFAQAGRNIDGVKTIIPNLQALLKAAREKGAFVVHLQQVTLPDNMSDGDAWRAFKTRDGKSPEYALPGSEGFQIIPELAPLETEVCVSKFRPSGFHGTFLDGILRANGIRTILITGTTTEGCVMSTVLHGSFHDYYTCVVGDCVASSVDKMHETAMAFMKMRFKILQSQDIADIWRK